MNLQTFYQDMVEGESAASQIDALHHVPNKIQISPSQGSRFAKEVADDFNPLHDPDSKRFCVPGDLLFSLVISRLGITQKMDFSYKGMVGGNTVLKFVEEQNAFRVEDIDGKVFLSGTTEGEALHNEAVIEGFYQEYAAFSGKSFPHILVPLMQQKDIMINPKRPMVIYEKMAFEFERPIMKLNVVPHLLYRDSEIEVSGKRGKVHIHFDIKVDERIIGYGTKTMTLSGLLPYDQSAISALIENYENSKSNYQKIAV